MTNAHLRGLLIKFIILYSFLNHLTMLTETKVVSIYFPLIIYKYEYFNTSSRANIELLHHVKNVEVLNMCNSQF